MTALLACCLAVTPVQTAELIPEGATVLHIDGGFALLPIGVPALEILPVLSGDLELGYGILDGLDLRGRYQVHLGVIHRLGPELRARFLHVGPLSMAARLWVSGQLGGAAQEAVEFAGDISTEPALAISLRIDDVALTLDGGITVQWVRFERFEDSSFVDRDPLFAYVNVGLSAEWAQSDQGNLYLRLEAAISTAPDDPFTIFGLQPRIVAGGSLRL
ncbi:MAG: hypothetical protein AAGF12_04465 [Myxococcota bacterium]